MRNVSIVLKRTIATVRTENFHVVLLAAVDLELCSSNVQDAFVIAVEQQARERLERLSALKRITPIDMNKLSQQVIIDHACRKS